MKKVVFYLSIVSLFALLTGFSFSRKDSRESIDIPVLMYHDIIKSPRRHGEYGISPDALEKDLQFLRDNGYTTIVTQDLINYVHRGRKLPYKPVMLTFDDGHYNNVYYAEPLLAQYGMRAAIFINGEFCEQSTRENAVDPNYSYVLWDEICAMQQRGIWDIQSHSWGLHHNKGRRGATRKRNESPEAYQALIAEDCRRIGDAIEVLTGRQPVAFAYPFGFADRESEAALRQNGIQVTLQSHQGMANIRRGDPASLSLIKRYLRSHHKSAEKLLG